MIMFGQFPDRIEIYMLDGGLLGSPLPAPMIHEWPGVKKHIMGGDSYIGSGTITVKFSAHLLRNYEVTFEYAQPVTLVDLLYTIIRQYWFLHQNEDAERICGQKEIGRFLDIRFRGLARAGNSWYEPLIFFHRCTK